jgi:hypothetical protein
MSPFDVRGRWCLQPSCFRDNLVKDMPEHDEPKPITAAEHRARIQRTNRIGHRLGFTGLVEYRHVYSRSGGAQYCIGPSAEEDLLVLYAEAFERDADPADFSLEALIAHECGHQRLIRKKDLRTILAKFPGEQFEEILASLVGSLLLGESESAQTLVWKATAELGQLGMTAASTVHFVERLRRLLRYFL